MRRSTIARTTLGLRIGVILLATFICVYEFVWTEYRKGQKLDKSIAEVTTEVQLNLKTLDSARRLLETVEKKHEKWEMSVLQKIPTQADVNLILEVLNDEASVLDLKMLNSYAKEEQEIEAKEAGTPPGIGQLFEIATRIEVSGNWRDIASFLDRMKELPRTVRINSVELTREEDFFPLIHGKISLDVFYCAAASDGVTPISRKL